MVDYKNVKIADDVIIVGSASTYKSWVDWRPVKGQGLHQGYVVDASNKKMLENARNWAEDRSGYDWNTRTYANRTAGTEQTYKNGQFELTLCDSADNSSQSGKLSFWNCIITCPDGKEFLVGINADILLELLLANTFIDGKCQNKVWLGRIAGKQVGAFTENMQLFEQAKKDEAARQANAAGKATYEPGDVVKTLTGSQVYLGTLYCYAEVDDSRYRYATIKLYKKPQIRHLFVGFDEDTAKMKDYIYEQNILKTKPKRVYDGHVASKTLFGYAKLADFANKQIADRHKSNPEVGDDDWYIYEYTRMLLTYGDSDKGFEEKQQKLIELIKKYRGRYDCNVEYVD